MKRSVSGRGSKNDQNEAAEPAASPPPAGAGAGAAGAPQEERTNYLVALAGMRALTSHVQDVSKGRTWKERVKGWEEKAGLTEPSVKLALGFLDILGVSACRRAVRTACAWIDHEGGGRGKTKYGSVQNKGEGRGPGPRDGEVKKAITYLTQEVDGGGDRSPRLSFPAGVRFERKVFYTLMQGGAVLRKRNTPKREFELDLLRVEKLSVPACDEHMTCVTLGQSTAGGCNARVERASWQKGAVKSQIIQASLFCCFPSLVSRPPV